MTSHTWVRENERPFLRSAEDWCTQVDMQGRLYLTEFLTPREQYLTQSVVGNRGLVARVYGGYEYAERERMLLMPDDWYPQPDDFQIHCLQVEAQETQLRHKDVLGSVLGLGLQRKLVGDIVVDEKTAYVFVSGSIANFIQNELRQIGRQSVFITQKTELPSLPAPAYDEKRISVASLRLDAVLAQACQLSRGKAQTAVERGIVTLNFAQATSRDEVAEGDLLSLRGFGRIKVYETLGTTRRDRLRVRVGILRSNA